MPADPLETLTRALSDRYRVERLLGSGGMATVYLARDLKHDRPVAIKVLRPELAAALGPERFLREIQIAARLNHPHILALHDSGEADGLLYYVMPYVEGESLQDRIAREKQLPVADAIRLTREVASALAYAHGLGFIHRDIKPGNILISNGYALVADFGLARALTRARGTDSITHSGITIGTPTYMSPEQGSDDAVIDGRSDIYALGCVAYEMLVGDPPFSGSTTGAVLARHAAGRVMPIRAIRPAVPVGAERAVLRALEKMPADRYQNAEEFGEGLRLGSEAISGGRLPRWITFTAVGVAAVGLGLAVWSASRDDGTGSRPGADTTRYAILGFEGATGNGRASLVTKLQDVLARWDSLTVVDRGRTAQALEGKEASSLDEGGARRAADRLGVGRYIRGRLQVLGDSTQASATLYDTRTGGILARANVAYTDRAGSIDSAARELADILLFRGRLPRGPGEGHLPSRSLAAVHAFIRGREAVTRWDLPSADSAFSLVLTLDGRFGEAAFWLAQIRAWQGIPARVWRLQAEQALAAAATLGPRDAVLADALSALGRRDFATACARWWATAQRWPTEYFTWYGAAVCLSQDDLVQRDRSSRSGWGFRSSVHRAQMAWRRAFVLNPEILRDFFPGGLHPGQGLLWVRTDRVRGGEAAPPDTGVFSAFPSWAGDTLAFIPYREREFLAGRAIVGASSTQEAIRRQRRLLFELATEWRSTSPGSLGAREAVAASLGILGNPSAPDSMHAARALATTLEDRIRLGVTEALMLVLGAAPEDTKVSAAKRLVDSLLATAGQTRNRSDPWDLATIAALTGRASLAAGFARLPSPRTAFALPPALASDALALLAFGALGGPLDSLVSLERRVAQGIASGIDPNGRVAARMEWLARPATSAFFDYPFPSLRELGGFGDYLVEAQLALQRGDTVAVRQQLADAAAGREWMQPSDVSLETLHPEAQLLSAIGQATDAAARLDGALAGLRTMSLDLIRSPVGAGLLVRSMALRAELASGAGDHATAARWAAPVMILWSDADSSLQQVTRRMRQFVRP